MNDKRRLFVFVFSLISALMIAALGVAQNAAQSNSANADKLLGSWTVEVTTPSQGTFPALLTFTSDGSVISSESPLPYESSGHGRWVSTSDGQAALTFIALFGSEQGANTGKLKVVATLRFNPATESWGGPFKIDVFDAAGNVAVSDKGSFNMTRIEVEPLN